MRPREEALLNRPAAGCSVNDWYSSYLGRMHNNLSGGHFHGLVRVIMSTWLDNTIISLPMYANPFLATTHIHLNTPRQGIFMIT